MAELGAIFSMLPLGVLYWAPGLIAFYRGHKQLPAILVVNFFGILILPWIIALAWAFVSEPGDYLEKTSQ